MVTQVGGGMWCLMPFSKIFQLYSGIQFYWWMKPEYPVKTNDMPQVTDNIYHIMECILKLLLFSETTSLEWVGCCKMSRSKWQSRGEHY
jgi:hypothetical protein